MGTIVAGVDFGTLSVRVSVFDSKRGRLGSGTAEYPLHRSKSDPDHATQSHDDHMKALAAATQIALGKAHVSGGEVAAIALDTTGSSVIPVGAGMVPLGEYYLWCDHRSWREAAEITAKAHEYGLPAIDWCGGVYSSEWGFSKLLHWLRHNPKKRGQLVSAFEHCDFVAAVLCGITDASEAPRSICAMGHKWLWNESLGGLPPEEFLIKVDPLLAGVRAKLQGRYQTSDKIAGHLSPYWAQQLGVKPGIPIPVGAFDAHWDAVGAGVGLGDVVNVIGTSTCIIGLSDRAQLVPGVCGVVPGSVDPKMTGVEAGLSAAIEGTAFHTRIILQRMEEHGASVRRIINGGGIPQKNETLNQVYANVLNKPILIPQGDVTSLGSAIFAFLAAGAFPSLEAAQKTLCPPHQTYLPEPTSVEIYNRLFGLYRKLYFSLGEKDSAAVSIGDVLPQLRLIAASVRAQP